MGVNWVGLTLNRDKWRAVVNTAVSNLVHKMREISCLDEKPLLLKKNSAPWSQLSISVFFLKEMLSVR